MKLLEKYFSVLNKKAIDVFDKWNSKYTWQFYVAFRPSNLTFHVSCSWLRCAHGSLQDKEAFFVTTGLTVNENFVIFSGIVKKKNIYLLDTLTCKEFS